MSQIQRSYEPQLRASKPISYNQFYREMKLVDERNRVDRETRYCENLIARTNNFIYNILYMSFLKHENTKINLIILEMSKLMYFVNSIENTPTMLEEICVKFGDFYYLLHFGTITITDLEHFFEFCASKFDYLSNYPMNISKYPQFLEGNEKTLKDMKIIRRMIPKIKAMF